MAGGAKGLLHAAVGAGEHVAAGAHGATNQHRLPRQLVVHRDQRVVRRESTSRSLKIILLCKIQVIFQGTNLSVD